MLIKKLCTVQTFHSGSAVGGSEREWAECKQVAFITTVCLIFKIMMLMEREDGLHLAKFYCQSHLPFKSSMSCYAQYYK